MTKLVFMLFASAIWLQSFDTTGTDPTKRDSLRSKDTVQALRVTADKPIAFEPVAARVTYFLVALVTVGGGVLLLNRKRREADRRLNDSMPR